MRLKIIPNHIYAIAFLAFSTTALMGCGKDDSQSGTTPDSSDVSPQFFSVVTFGDSLSDTGNIKYLTEQFAGDSSPLLKRSVPIAPKDDYAGYYSGRFSNGQNWSDYFLDALHLKKDDAKTCFFIGSNNSCNYAIGGATTDENLTSDNDPMKQIKSLFKNTIVETILKRFKIPQHVGIHQMVATYLNKLQPQPSIMSHTLYVIWGGANDYYSGEAPETTVSNLISSIKNILDYNPDNQIRYFLIPNLPDLGKTPFGEQNQDLYLSAKTFKHNKLLREQIMKEIVENPEYGKRVVVVQVDIAEMFRNVYNNPDKYGFTNVTEACYLGGYMPGTENTACFEPQQYVFWDNNHPTTRAHCLAAKASLQALKNSNLLAKPEVVDDLRCE
jgi:phospholipase/lecithinase/hemolysin